MTKKCSSSQPHSEYEQYTIHTAQAQPLSLSRNTASS
eukprot:CAMPEP_0183779292 /NCGR_PEP_ID=MMETSP0739-20130205/53609_1 /TAXON_ID=385413 /ORGANISM="Thalassiosira miniscula, Strain CCMP1093" /LENGTH=36 /DNA_ID= /DNA_START= /DNA_END= /DNA_ORIENTATION=